MDPLRANQEKTPSSLTARLLIAHTEKLLGVLPQAAKGWGRACLGGFSSTSGFSPSVPKTPQTEHPKMPHELPHMSKIKEKILISLLFALNHWVSGKEDRESPI